MHVPARRRNALRLELDEGYLWLAGGRPLVSRLILLDLDDYEATAGEILVISPSKMVYALILDHTQRNRPVYVLADLLETKIDSRLVVT